MSKKKINQHVIPFQKGWAVKGEENEMNTARKRFKLLAILRARKIARNQKSELIIHGKDGKIQFRISCGNGLP